MSFVISFASLVTFFWLTINRGFNWTIIQKSKVRYEQPTDQKRITNR